MDFTLIINGEPLISEAPEAWDNGPVFRTLWQSLRRWGSAPIGGLLTPNNTVFFALEGQSDSKPFKANLTSEEDSVIDRVWRRYSRYSAFELSDMTHRPNTPWTQVYFSRGKSAPIPNDLIEAHYRNLALAGRSSG